ncbi:AhpD-like protein [Talaromyces proteolyticus]|uniref:AhpD-like protein n=1 Tax=Talaromyces proteolyticus TaxID=1131652 RepID=A0AAD4Q567_9EURO|nr:AhpD-like protein [Talaromyces proteolyticus]KAH8703715.1 AhpD-like protein [Talaromyces proteolyticus]
MNRLGLLHPSELDENAKTFYDKLYSYTTTKYGGGKAVFMKKDGRFVGPFGAELHTPMVGEHFLGMTKAISQLPGLSPKNREIAVIVTGAKFNAAYELYGHRYLALSRGISEDEFDTIVHGQCPANFTNEEKSVFEFAHGLVHKSGPLSQDKWDNVLSSLGKDTATALVQVVAFYSYVSVVLNGFDCQVPNVDD